MILRAEERKTSQGEAEESEKSVKCLCVESWLKTKELSMTISCCWWGAGSLSHLRVHEKPGMAF